MTTPIIWETARVQIPVIRRHFQHKSLDSSPSHVKTMCSSCGCKSAEGGKKNDIGSPEYEGLNHHGDLPFKEMDKIYKDIRKEREYNMNHPKDGSKVPLSRRKDWELIDDELLDDSPPLLTTEALYEDKSGNSNTFYTIPFHFDLTNYTSPFKINPNDKNDYRWDYPNFNFDPVNPRGYVSLIIGDGKDEGKIISSHKFKGIGWEMNAETFAEKSGYGMICNCGNTSGWIVRSFTGQDQPPEGFFNTVYHIECPSCREYVITYQRNDSPKSPFKMNAESFEAEGILCRNCPMAGRHVVIRKDHTDEDGNLICPFCHSNKNFKNIPETTYLLHGGKREDLNAESFESPILYDEDGDEVDFDDDDYENSGWEKTYEAESFSAEKEKRSKYMEYIYDMFYTPDSDAYKIREERVLPSNDSTYRLASQVGIAFDKRQRPFDSVLHNNLKGLSMTSQPYYYHIPYKGELFVFSYIVKGRGKNKQGYHTYYPPDSQFGEEQICGIETKHGDDCYCYQKNYKAESFSADAEYIRDSKGRFAEKPLLTGSVIGGLALGLMYFMGRK